MAASQRTIWSTLEPQAGYWDPITSTIVSARLNVDLEHSLILCDVRIGVRLCYLAVALFEDYFPSGEQNYQHSPYVAEYWNTLTNLVFMFITLFALLKSWQQNVDSRYLLTYFLLLTVALGSFLFHLTLKYHWQLADELPMLIVSTQTLYILLETSKTGSPAKGGILLPLFLTALVVVISSIYLVWGNPVFHQVAYATILLSAVSRATYLLRTRLNQTPFEWIQNMRIRGSCKLGSALFLLGFFIWNIDNLACNRFQPYKDAWGLPLSYLFEGHAHWHILTGWAGVILAVSSQWLALSLKEGAEAWDVKWTYGIPWLSRRALIKQE